MSGDERAEVAIAAEEELERSGDWRLVRRSLDCRSFGINLVEIAPGAAIPEHDERERDQEEVFYLVSGSAALLIDGAEHPIAAGTFARLDPGPRRSVRNTGAGPARLLIVSAPRSSGFEPMEWA